MTKKKEPLSRAGEDHSLGRAKKPSSRAGDGNHSLGRVTKSLSRAGDKPPRKRPSKAAKPPRDQSDAGTSPAREAAAGEQPGPSKAVPEDQYEGKLYTVGSWKGLPNYECLFCGYATVNHQSALEHAAEIHAPDPDRIINTGLVDETGAPITRAVQPAKED